MEQREFLPSRQSSCHWINSDRLKLHCLALEQNLTSEHCKNSRRRETQNSLAFLQGVCPVQNSSI